jgi:hypothetical protein
VLEVAIMVEGLCYAGLYRSDHFPNKQTGWYSDSLEPGKIVERVGRLCEAGVQRVMLQWLEVDDIDALEAMAQTVLPQLTAG